MIRPVCIHAELKNIKQGEKLTDAEQHLLRTGEKIHKEYRRFQGVFVKSRGKSLRIAASPMEE